MHGFVRAMLKEGQNYLSTTQPDGRARLLSVETRSQIYRTHKQARNGKFLGVNWQPQVSLFSVEGWRMDLARELALLSCGVPGMG